MPEIPPEYLVVTRTIIPYEQRFPEICYWVDKRRHGWSLHDPCWDDVRQDLLIDVHKVFDQFDPERGTFGQFVNKVITSRLKNYWRDNYAAYARPCVANGGCAHNVGDNLCRITPSGTQCSECPWFAAWQKKKGSQWAVRQTLPIVNHVDENQSKQTDFLDIDEKAKALHKAMKTRLTTQEWKCYRLLVIQGLEKEEVAIKLGFPPAPKRKKGRKKQGMYPGYAVILSMEKRFYALAQKVIEETSCWAA